MKPKASFGAHGSVSLSATAAEGGTAIARPLAARAGSVRATRRLAQPLSEVHDAMPAREPRQWYMQNDLR